MRIFWGFEILNKIKFTFYRVFHSPTCKENRDKSDLGKNDIFDENGSDFILSLFLCNFILKDD